LQDERVFNIELRDVIDALKRKHYIIILVTVPILLLSVYYAKTKTMTYYEAVASLTVGSYVQNSTLQPSIEDITNVLELMETYRLMVTTAEVCEKTIAKMNLDMTSEQLKDLVTADFQPGTPYLDITLRWTNSEEASAILDALVETYISEVVSIFPPTSIKVVDKESNPGSVTEAGQNFYTLTSRLVISINSGNDGSNASQYRLANISSYLVSEEAFYAIAKMTSVAEKVIDKTSLNVSPGFLKSSISVNLHTNTPFMDVMIRWPNYEEVINILDGFVETYIEEVKRFYPSSEIRILEKDEEPDEIIISNDTFYIGAGLAGGLLLSLLMIFALEFMNDSIRTERDVESAVQLPLIGLIPKGRKGVFASRSEIPDKRDYAVIEAYKMLRSNMYHSPGNTQVVAVTSGMPGEGKTMTASRLAVALAQDGKRTILVDCNMRKPNVHYIFKTSEIGLSNILMDGCDWCSAVHKCEVENLTVMAAGTALSNPAEFLSSDAMKRLLEALRNEFDYIILDTPPVNLLTDSQVLSGFVDGYIMVVCSGKSAREKTLRAKRLLQCAQANIIGVVLTGIRDTYAYRYYKELSKLQRQKIRNMKKAINAEHERDNDEIEHIMIFPSPKTNES